MLYKLTFTSIGFGCVYMYKTFWLLKGHWERVVLVVYIEPLECYRGWTLVAGRAFFQIVLDWRARCFYFGILLSFRVRGKTFRNRALNWVARSLIRIPVVDLYKGGEKRPLATYRFWSAIDKRDSLAFTLTNLMCVCAGRVPHLYPTVGDTVRYIDTLIEDPLRDAINWLTVRLVIPTRWWCEWASDSSFHFFLLVFDTFQKRAFYFRENQASCLCFFDWLIIRAPRYMFNTIWSLTGAPTGWLHSRESVTKQQGQKELGSSLPLWFYNWIRLTLLLYTEMNRIEKKRSQLHPSTARWRIVQVV